MTSAPQEEEKAQPQIEKAVQAKRQRDINWAAALATVIGLPLALAAIMLGFFQKEARQILGLDATPIPSPTLQAFAPSKPGESLIIVADFERRPADAGLKADPAQYIYEELKKQARIDNLDIRVERLRQVVDDNSARPTGQVYSATLLIWGWYDDVAINPRIERFGLKTTYVSDQEGRRFILANPERIDTILLDYLPSQVKYVIFFTLSLEQAERRELDDALRYADSALASVQAGADVNLSETYFHRGSIYQTQGNNDQAIADYDQAITLKPAYAEAFYNRGVAHAGKGELNRAIADYNQVITFKPDLAEAFYNRGNAYADKSKLDRAIADYDQAIMLEPDHVKAFNNRGDTFLKKGEVERAIADFDQAIKLRPDLAEVFNNRGQAYADKGEVERAIADFDQAIKLRPDLAEAFYNRGNVYADKGEVDRAIQDFDQAIKLRPDDAEAFNNRGSAYFKKGEKEKAIADYNEVIRLKPNLAEAFKNRGIALGSKGELDRAIADFDQAIKLRPDDAEAFRNRGVAYFKKGEKVKAIADLKQALSLAQQPTLRQQLEEMLKTVETS